MGRYDMIITNGRIVFPGKSVIEGSIGINEGKITAIKKSLSVNDANAKINAKGNLIIPGIVDSHYHIGIYRPFKVDALSESAAAVTGGVTTIIS